MSVGLLSSVTTGQLQQVRTADADRGAQQVRAHQQQTTAVQRAEAADGVGEMTEDAATSDRDADGRRLWEPAEERGATDSATSPSDGAPRSRDPTGLAGGQLDLTG